MRGWHAIQPLDNLLPAHRRYVRIWDDQDEALQPEWEIDPKDLQILEKVGEGEFGTVHRAKWYGTIVAVKILRRSDAVAVGDFRCWPAAGHFATPLCCVLSSLRSMVTITGGMASSRSFGSAERLCGLGSS